MGAELRDGDRPDDGDIRFLDQRGYASNTLTLGTDPVHPTPLSRDMADCFQRVYVRGQSDGEYVPFQAIAKRRSRKTSPRQLVTNAAAIAAWTPQQQRQTGTFQDTGTVTCTNTTTVVITSTNTSLTLTSDILDQTANDWHATINLYYSAGCGVNMMWTASVLCNTATRPGSRPSRSTPRSPTSLRSLHTLLARAGISGRVDAVSDRR